MAEFQDNIAILGARVEDMKAEMRRLREENATLKKEVDTLLEVCQHAPSESYAEKDTRLKQEFQSIMLKYYNEEYIDCFIGVNMSNYRIMMWAFADYDWDAKKTPTIIVSDH